MQLTLEAQSSGFNKAQIHQYTTLYFSTTTQILISLGPQPIAELSLKLLWLSAVAVAVHVVIVTHGSNTLKM